MDQIILVKLGEFRGISPFHLNSVESKRSDFVILEVDRGTEWGQVISEPNQQIHEQMEAPQGKILRKATEGDLNQIKNNRMKAIDATNVCLRKINERKLKMQIVKTEYTFDSSKIIFFFVAEGRVDFRALVQDLAKIFRVRIELKQIGVRDRAKIIGGCGVCGRALCCASYLKAFHTLSIRMAKDQNLPLNPARISGSCGRIKCCMAYEFMAYKDLAKDLPHVGDKITVGEAKGKVIDINILKRYVRVDLGEGKITKVSFNKSDEK